MGVGVFRHRFRPPPSRRRRLGALAAPQVVVERTATGLTASIAVYDMIPGTRHGYGGFISEQGMVYQDFTSEQGAYIVTVTVMAVDPTYGIAPRLDFSIEEWAESPSNPNDHAVVATLVFEEVGSATISFAPGYRDKPYRLSYAETRGDVNFSVAFLIIQGSDYPP